MSNDLRRTLEKAMALNEAHVDASRMADVTLSTEEAALLESLAKHPGFAGYPKEQLDRHTIKHLLVSTGDTPVSVCERAARKAEILMFRGALTENLTAANGVGSLCEAEVPEERPEAPEGEGDLPQGDADSLSGENDGEDHQSPGKEDSEADDDGTKQGGSRGDQSDTAKKGYKDEKKESKDVEHGHDEDDAFQLESDDEDEDDLDEEDDANAVPADSVNEEGAEGTQNDAKDPAPEDDRAASDAKYKDGCKQNEAKCDDEDDEDDEDEMVNEDDLSRDDETKDVKDHPDYDNVQKEDPANSELDKGPAEPKLESLESVEKRICNILSEAGIKKGSQRWTEAYLRGWNLAMEHRATKLGS